MSQEVVGYESGKDRRERSVPLDRRLVLPLIATGLVTAVVVVGLHTPRVRDGALWARVEVEVHDAATGRPVPGASVALLDVFGMPIPPNVSPATPADANGRATTRVIAGMGSADYLLYEQVQFSTRQDESVQVTAPGYAPATVTLPRGGSTSRRLGGRIDPVLRVRVDLEPAPATQPGAP